MSVIERSCKAEIAVIIGVRSTLVISGVLDRAAVKTFLPADIAGVSKKGLGIGLPLNTPARNLAIELSLISHQPP